MSRWRPHLYLVRPDAPADPLRAIIRWERDGRSCVAHLECGHWVFIEEHDELDPRPCPKCGAGLREATR